MGEENDAQRDFMNMFVRAFENVNLGQQPQQRRVHVRSIPCANFVTGQDFRRWLQHFQDNVRAAYELPRNSAELPAHYANWISTKMDPGPTRTVYDNLIDGVKDDWALLEPALDEAFKNEDEGREFTSRLDAYQREKGQALREYKDELRRRMDKYRGALRAVPAEWEREAIHRFRSGLKNKFMDANILMHCSADDATLNQAFEFTQNWENTLSHMTSQNQNRGEVEPLVAAMKGLPIPAQDNPVNISTMQMPVPTNHKDETMDHMQNQLKQQQFRSQDWKRD
jgi:truncated hemoglobin YjbI